MGDLDAAIRAGTAADAEAAAALVHLADVARRGPSPLDAQTRERSARRLADPSTFFVLAETDTGAGAGTGGGRGPVGVAAGMPGRAGGGAGDRVPGLCHISMVAVRPESWGRGLGGRVLDAVIDEARRRGYAQAQLFTQTANARARALYGKRGFVLTGQTSVDEIGDEILHYLLDLDASPVGMDERLGH
ncbi:GNAT family N-acetyltransferase [Spirillospora sp. CA-255316]